MAKPGVKPLPSNVHRLNGNQSKLSAAELKGRDAVLPVTSIPDAPSHLTESAKAEWDRVTPVLKKLGLITDLDMAALAAYCQAYGRWHEAETKIKELGDKGLVETTPSGYKQMSVLLQVSNRAVDQMHKFMTEFGMTPSNRTSVTPSPQPDLFGDDKTAEKEKYFS